MKKRRVVIAANWKMNKTPKECEALVKEILPKVKNSLCEVILCVPFVDLAPVLRITEGSAVKIGAQNCYFEDSGAFTGEISPRMLRSMGVDCVIVGHSERRTYFAEDNETVNKKVHAALKNGLRVILCVGETLKQREQGVTNEAISTELKIALSGVEKEDMDKIIIAYEPLWAIGTGKTATGELANGVCGFIRELVNQIYGEHVAESLVVQYGGSMNAKNAPELLSCENIDGGLIGGASLKSEDFFGIVKAANS